MAKVQSIVTNFTAGEISPRVRGRVDVARYQNAVDVMRNAHPVVQGGAKRRAGFRYLGALKNANKKARFIPFVFSSTQAYMLEFGDLYFRVWHGVDHALQFFEASTVYTEAQLPDIRFAQRADTMFMAHPAHPIQRVRRFDHASWDIGDAPFDPLPFDEVGFTPATTLTLTAATVGTGRTATAGAATFLAADVGRDIWSGAGVATITGYTSTTVVTVEIKIAFASASIASGAWQVKGSPQTDCTPSESDPAGKSLTLTLGAAGWRSSDVGKHVRINFGTVEITGYSSTTVVNGIIRSILSSATASPADAWTLESSIWNASDGYPSVAAFYQQALYAGGTTNYPQTIWRSKIGDAYDFTLGIDDDSAFSYTLDSNEQNQLQHLHPMQTIVALSNSAGFSMYGGVEKPITPTNIQVDPESDQGANNVRPVRVGKELLHVQRAGFKVRSLQYQYSSDDYQGSELSVLSTHLTEAGIVDMAYQQEPDPLVWFVLGDGTLASLILSREQEVMGWSRHDTDGVVESIATIPSTTGNEVWCIVKRTINGSVVRYAEVLNGTLSTDCAITGTSVGGADTWSGLAHLEGETVYCKADGVFMGEFTVASGAITLTRDAFAVEIGLPYTHAIKTLSPEIPGSVGTIQGVNQRISKAVLRVLESVGFNVNGQYVDFRRFGEGLLDQPPPTFTGDYPIETLGWDHTQQITLDSDLPFPFHVLAVIYTLTANTG